MFVLLAMVMVALAVAGCGEASPATNGEPQAGEAPSGAQPRDASGDGGDAGAPATSGGEGLPLPQLADRKIIRTATLELEVEDVSAAVREVEDAAVAAGGFVSESNIFVDQPDDDGSVESPRRTQTATVTVRVPAGEYVGVMEQLRGIAKQVRSERSEASEVTEEYTDLEARLRNLETTEASYLELLKAAGEIPDILLVQDRLSQVRLEIEQVQGRINLLDNLTDLATITIQLSLPAAAAGDGGKNWAQKAWDVAWEGSQETAKALGSIAIVGGIALLWLAIPALVGFAAWRRFGWRLPRPPQGGAAGGPAPE
jgi:hypothetical protein